MGQLKLDGSISAAPQTVSDGVFPGGIISIALALNPITKSWSRKTMDTTSVVSPGVYVTLPGLGVGSALTRGDFLYFKSDAPVKLRMTQVGTPDLVGEVNVQGTLILEFPSIAQLKLLEIQGTATVEYLIVGST